jgi:hypothetical protein
VPLSKKKGSNWTLLGAIGSCLNGPCNMIGEATSEVEVLRFIKKLALAKKKPESKPYLVMVSASELIVLNILSCKRIRPPPTAARACNVR